MASTGGIFLTEKTVSELLRSMTADGLIMDKLERARHGFTVADVIKAIGKQDEDKRETESAEK